ncbi:hypothetical protein [Vibrio sp. MA40-2]|uniref:hypothetical protein n=1 Tax=Vibrio sp. MA40-2 TaxID=3391828 RepID=UPI0039A75E56
MKDEELLFVHSLFRTGSTYFYSKLKNSGVRSFQEPIHEIVIQVQQKIKTLENNDKNIGSLRHENLVNEYYTELSDLEESVLDILGEDDIYADYFSKQLNPSLEKYIFHLITSTKDKIAIQECRTSNRIGIIKNKFSGKHVYLYRNPLDQWWSYRVDRYFDTTSQLIFGSNKEQSEEVCKLKALIGSEAYRSDNLLKEFHRYHCEPMDFRSSYLAFYSLWILGLLEAFEHADLLINIDDLSISSHYQHEITDALAMWGYENLDFKDCNSPLTPMGSDEKNEYLKLECEVEEVLLNSDVNQEVLQKIIELKLKQREQLSTMSELNQSAQQVVAKIRKDFLHTLDTESYYAKCLSKELRNMEARNIEIESNYKRIEKINSDIVNSLSWKLTKPVRAFLHFKDKLLLIFRDKQHFKVFVRNKITRFPKLHIFLRKIIQGSPLIRMLFTKYGFLSEKTIPWEELNKKMTPNQKNIFNELTRKN